MKLNELQIELLKRVRERFAAIDCDRKSLYICLELKEVAIEVRKELSDFKAIFAAEDIAFAITGALDGRNAMEAWLVIHYPKAFKVSLHEQYRIMYHARCAWLDRMIETGECV
ncbi:hypothetical protein CPT_Maja_100 [Burkholderia phage Maja]|uniref:Uncharacterized protein n=1 Tax=Burkholderia phage Maja TaxID=2767571 RepID=A0A7S6R7B6_9CAUD|nr:hypothetical protein CPT_Maja_100 [Burkholderia phage Maja]